MIRKWMRERLVRLMIIISEFSIDSNEKNVSFEVLFEKERDDEDDDERNDKSIINAFISSVRSESSSE